jgi:hypothetical protein
MEKKKKKNQSDDSFYIALVIFCIKLRNLGYAEGNLLKMVSAFQTQGFIHNNLDEINHNAHRVIHQEKSVYNLGNYLYKKGVNWILKSNKAIKSNVLKKDHIFDNEELIIDKENVKK